MGKQASSRFRLAMGLTRTALALLTLAGPSAWSAPREVVEERTAFFRISQARESIERREYNISTAEFDLSSADLEIGAALLGDSVLNPGRLEQGLPLKTCLLAAATDSFTTVSLSDPRAGLGLPNGPFIHEGNWIVSPEGLSSAVGLTADKRAVFATNWLARQPAAWLSMQLETESGERRPITALNRMPLPNAITALTYEFSPARRIRVTDPGARLALLTPAWRSESDADRLLSGIGGARDWQVYKLYAGESVCSIGRGMVLLYGLGDEGRWLEARLQRNQRLRIRFDGPAQWNGVREAVGLGAPLIWEGRPVGFEDLSALARPRWADPASPSRPIVAYFPRRNRLQIVWSEAQVWPRRPVSRRAMVERLLAQGARCAFEFACEEAQPLIFIGPQRVGRRPTASLSPPAPTALVFRQADPRAPDRLVNLCHAENAKAVASGPPALQNLPGAAVDGRYGIEMSMDQFWCAPAPEGASPPAWIEIDLRRPHPVSRVEIFHAEYVGFSSHFNTADLRVLGRRQPTDPWALLGQTSDNWSGQTVFDAAQPRPLQFIRIEILRANRVEANPRARLAEILVWGAPSRE